MTEHTHPYANLTPDFIMDAIEAMGYWCNGSNLALNSYENRVWQVGIEEDLPIIAKFYRPNRWSNEQIAEEHQFCFDLKAQELPVVAPMVRDGRSLFEFKGFQFALFERKGGHAPELDNPDHLFQLGQHLAPFHLLGKTRKFAHRPDINLNTFGEQSVEFIVKSAVPAELRKSYAAVTEHLLDKMRQKLKDYDDVEWIRVHGDCHGGNMLWRDDAPHFVDFDDSRNAPAVQDLWMLLSGDRFQQEGQLIEVLEGYHEFNEFNLRELGLIEVLRTLRMLHHAYWLASRWQDPAFPMAFPWFNTERYWGEHILQLKEQLFALDEKPLKVML